MKRTSFQSRFWRYCLFLLFLLSVIQPNVASAQVAAPFGSIPGSAWLVGERTFDHYKDSVDVTSTYLLDTGSVRNLSANDDECVRWFLMRWYITDTLKLHISYIEDDSAIADTYPYAVNIVRDSDNFVIWDNVTFLGDYYFVGDEMSIHQGNLPELFAPGNYTMNWTRIVNGNYQLKYQARFTVLRPVNKVWLEAESLCSIDSNYHFKIKTDPPIDSLMFYSESRDLTHWPGLGDCERGEAISYNFRCRAGKTETYDPTAYDSAMLVYRTGYPTDPIAHHPTGDIKGSDWTGPGVFSDDYFIKYHEDDTHYSGEGYVGMEYYEDNPSSSPVNIYVHVDDGIQHWNYTAPMPKLSRAHLESYTVTGDEVWTPDNNAFTNMSGMRADKLRIGDGGITVNPGAKLEIHDMRLDFYWGGKINILPGDVGENKAGGKVKIFDTKLSCYYGCDSDYGYWQGVVVGGIQNQSQSSIYQGLFAMKNSTMAYAMNGIVAADPITLLGGGEVRATNSTFKNNRLSVIMGAYQNINPYTLTEVNNFSSFQNCDFIYDEESEWNDLQAFIYGVNVHGIRVNGCRFVKSTDRGNSYGIYGSDMSVIVDHMVQTHLAAPPDTMASRFSGLNKGVYIRSANGSAGLQMQHTRVDNNLEGVHLDGVNVPELKYNRFEVPLSNRSIAPYYIGAAIYTGSGYQLHHNIFTGTNGSTFRKINIGVLASNTGMSDNQVHHNAYSSMGVGNLSNYKNQGLDILNRPRGLEFLCNAHSGGRRSDEAARGANNTNDGMKAEQGKTNLSAGNVFSGGGLDNIYLNDAEVLPLTYYYYGSIPNSVGSVTKTVALNNNTCTSPTEPDDGNGGIGHPYIEDYGIAVRGNVAGLQPEAPHLGDATLDLHYAELSSGGMTREMVYHNINHYMLDSNGVKHRDSLYYWLAQAQTAQTDLMLCDMVLNDAAADSATMAGMLTHVYDSISQWYGLDSIEAREYSQGRVLLELRMKTRIKGKTPMLSYSSGDEDEIQAVADSCNGWARMRALSILALLNPKEKPYEYEVLYPETEDSCASKPGRNTNNNIMSPVATPQAGSKGMAYPNPVHDYLNLLTEEDMTGASVSIYDMLGRELLSKELKGKSSIIDMRALAPGQYLYKVSSQGLLRMEGKVSKIE